MKQVSPELLEYLHTRREFYMCELYEIQLLSGLTFRYANYDMPITLPDGRFFTHKGPIFKRTRTKLTSKITVDKMNVTITVDGSDQMAGESTMQIAHNGGFDGTTLTLYRCFMDAPGVVVGTVEWFGGDVDVKDGGGTDIELEVKSAVQRLNVEWPLRKYYPTCPYSLYDTGCGLERAAFEKIGTVTGVNSQQDFNTNLSFADNYFDQGGIEWLTGPLAGSDAPIKASYNGRLVMLIPLEAAPIVGNTFRVYPGCNKTPPTCQTKFDNYLRNRATPYIPLKETIM